MQYSKVLTVLSPLRVLRNFGFTVLINGYFGQNFSLSNLQQAMPKITASLLKSVANNDEDELDNILTPEGKTKLLNDWKYSLSRKQKENLSKVKSVNCFNGNIRIRMPETKSKTVEAHVNILFHGYFLFKDLDPTSYLKVLAKPPSDPKLLLEITKNDFNLFEIEMEKEITKGKNSEWYINSIKFQNEWKMPV